MHANEPVPRERLIDELWRDAAPRTVNAVLSVYLSRLRRLLADGAGKQLLLTEAAGYVLHVPPEGLDARRFEALQERGRRELANGDAERASMTLRDALALWRGAALADLAFEPFAQNEIARLEELRLTALETRIEADLALGRQDALIAELETLVAAHPYREGLCAQLMLALYRSGRQAEALEAYRRTRQAFSLELGIEPGPRLQALETAILRHDPSLEAPGSETLSVREHEGTESVRKKRPLPTRMALSLAAALVLVVVAAAVAVARHSSGGSLEPVVLAGDSVAVVDPGTGTIVGEILVGGTPTGPAVGEGSVWVGNREDKTLLRIDPISRTVTRTIGLGVPLTDIEVGAGSVWVLSDRDLLRVDPEINDVVAKVRLPGDSGQPWTHMEIGANLVYVCRCGPIAGALARIDPAATDPVSVHEAVVGAIAYGNGALWALTGYELDTIQRIDPETNAVTETIPFGRIGAIQGARYRIAVGTSGIWVASSQAVWRIDPTTNRITGSIPIRRKPLASNVTSVATDDGAVWVTDLEGSLLRVDSKSQTLARTISLGKLIYPADSWDTIDVGEGAVWIAVTSFAS